jgi:hypothetical protein
MSPSETISEIPLMVQYIMLTVSLLPFGIPHVMQNSAGLEPGNDLVIQFRHLCHDTVCLGATGQFVGMSQKVGSARKGDSGTGKEFVHLVCSALLASAGTTLVDTNQSRTSSDASEGCT